MSDEAYRGSSPSWLRTLKESVNARRKVKSLATAIAEGKRQDDVQHEEEERQTPPLPSSIPARR
jgi:hypothetical protein